MARRTPPAPAGAAVPPEAMRAALAVVSECLRAEAQAQWDAGAANLSQRAAHVRISLALSAVATRIESATA